jgi:hypothetical protein
MYRNLTGRVEGPLQEGICKDAEEYGPGHQDGKCGDSIAGSGRAKMGVSAGDIHHPCADPDSQNVQRDPRHTKSRVGFHLVHITVEGR